MSEDEKRSYLKPMSQGLITIPKRIREDFDVDGDEDKILLERETTMYTESGEPPKKIIEEVRQILDDLVEDKDNTELDEELVEKVKEDLVLSRAWTLHPFKIPGPNELK